MHGWADDAEVAGPTGCIDDSMGEIFTSLSIVVDGGEHQDAELSRLKFQHGCSCGRIAREALPIFAVISVGSLLTFVLGTIYFGVLLHGPPSCPGVDWTACADGEATTAWGRAVPLRVLRAWASLPKIWALSIMNALLLWIYLGKVCCSLVTAVSALAAIPMAISAYYAATVAPLFVDPVVSFFQLLVLAIFLYVNRRPATEACGACCTFMLYALLILVVGLAIFTSNVIDIVKQLGWWLPPSVLACGVTSMARGTDFLLRTALRLVGMPSWLCVLMLILYQNSVYIGLRRYALQYDDLSDVVMLSAASAGTEFACNVLAAAWAVYSYNEYLKEGHPQDALRYLSMFVTSAVTEAITEHIALHSNLACGLFVDTRSFAIAVGDSVVGAWAVQTAFEIMCDAATMVVLFGLLPLRFTRMLDVVKGRRWLVGTWYILQCAWVHTIAVHNTIMTERFVCNG